jgi:Family of unknown function (DUF6328)
MPSPEARLKDLLDETRLTMLGTQLLMGLQYRAAFDPGFERLPPTFRWLDGAALLLILAASALLLATPCLHQIAEGGHASGRMLRRASANLKAALLPIGLALGLDVAIGLVSEIGISGSLAVGSAFALGAWITWYWIPLRVAAKRGRREAKVEDKEQSLETRIVQALTELRVILPGAQALFGFQFAAVLTDSFGRLPGISKAVHLLSAGLVAVAIVMLIAPAAYHRIAAEGNAEERVLRYTVRMMLPAVGLLSLGLVGDAYVTVRKISDMPWLALGVSLVALGGFVALLYGIPLAARRVKPQATAANASG